jgi:hypothetical protein
VYVKSVCVVRRVVETAELRQWGIDAGVETVVVCVRRINENTRVLLGRWPVDGPPYWVTVADAQEIVDTR